MGSRRRNIFILLLVIGMVLASLAVIATKKTVLGLDLRGGTELVYEARPTPQNPEIDDQDIDRAIDIIRERTDTLGVSEPEISRETGPERRQAGAEAEETLELLTLLRRPVPLVVQVLAAPGRVRPRRLEPCSGVRRDPDVGPGRRDGEAADALERVLVGYLPSAGVDVAEAPPSETAPATLPSHRPERTPTTAGRNPARVALAALR